ncbi:MAG TPA: DUF2855 family protein [Polyangiaceae bacterium]|nr:DUF2855 family protein [Polyangiaceae bacterium]
MTTTTTPPAPTPLDFLVRRDDLRACRFAPAPPLDDVALDEGQALLRVDHFGLTSNNVTYALAGDRMGYWRLFPAPEGWGRVPAWGYGEVLRSRHEGVRPGERYYGLYPTSTSLVVRPGRVGGGGFSDESPHRQPLSALYNRYVCTATDPTYDPAREAEQALLRPLFTTSFLLDDYLAAHDFFGARTVVIASASSKTACGLAWLLAARRPGPAVLGLTSAAHAPFVARVGGYARAFAYDQIAALPTDAPAVYVDLSGDAALRASVHRHYGDALTHSCSVGATHWQQLRPGDGGAPGPKAAPFFAPSWAEKRAAELGPPAFGARANEAWRALLDRVVSSPEAWLRVVRGRGPDALERAYLDLVLGRAKPDEGHLLSLA